MGTKYFTMYFHTIIILAFLNAVASQDNLFGVISLRPSPSEDATLYSASLNDDSGFVNVTFLLYDNSTNLPTVNGTNVIDEDVIVRCNIITPHEDGNSRVTFFEAFIPSFADGGSVDFRVVDQGRTVEIQCCGETDPDSPGTTSYFSFNTSAGPTGLLVVKKSPVVSFCDETILVPYSPDISLATVQLELSEPVDVYPATVSCDIIGIIDVNNSLWLNFEDTTVQPGASTEVRVSYSIERIGEIVQVACYAVSAQGTQYLQSTSQGELAIFTLDTGSASLIPSEADIIDPRISAFLYLGAPLGPNEGTVTYACYLDPVYAYEQGLAIALNPTCVTPSDVFDRPTPAEPGPTTAATTAITTPNINATTAGITTRPTTTPAPTTTPIPPTTPTTPAPPTPTQGSTTSPRRSNDTTTAWQLQQSEIVFEEGDFFKELIVELDPSTPSFSGAVLVSCCAPQDINSNPKYINTSAAMVFYATVQEPMAFNWTLATDSSNRYVESSLPNPAYVDLSPCPCDMTSGHCDADCCCDEDCNSADTLVFTCSDSTEGDSYTIHDCNSTDLYKADWSPLLCVQTSNSPYLGLYQSTRAAIRDMGDFSSAKTAAQTSRDTSYHDSGRRSLEYTSPDGAEYSNGDPVELLYDENLRGFLALPQMTLGGECLWTSPVQFQEDLGTRCTLPPTQRLCQEFSPFSALMFLRPSTESYPPCPKEPRVADRYGQSTSSPTDVEYYCLEDISDYVLEETVEEDIYDMYESSLFAEYQNSSSEEKVPQRCSWDDGYTQPPAPFYDNATSLCFNSVVSVSYEMFWRGGEIIRIRGVVILGAVTVVKDSTIDTGDVDAFITPPPTTPAPPTTATPTTTPSTAMISITNGVTIVTDLTEIFETVITDIFATENATNMFIFMDDNSTTAATDNVTQSTTMMPQGTTSATTPVGLTPPPTTPLPTTFGTSPTAGATMGVTSPAALPNTTPNITTAAMSNTTMGILNENITTDMNTELPPTTPAPFTPVITRPLNITLQFSTTFTYLPETVVDPLTGQTAEPDPPFQRSGNPGYVIGKPLLSGVVLETPLVIPTTSGPPINCTEFPSSPSCIEVPENETVYVFESVDTSPNNQLQMFSPGAGSLCIHSSTAILTFGEDTASGCILRMGQSELANCTILAAYMQEQLRALVPSDRIGKSGNSSVLDEEDWAEVFNPDDHPYDPPTTMPPTTEAPLPETTSDPLTTRFPGQRYVDPDTPVQPLEQLMYTCSDVPTSVNLEVLITEAGVYSGVPQYEVLAARVTYTTSTVRLTCSGAEGASCFLANTPIVANSSGDGTVVQSFPVYSTVTYTTVPAQEPEPVIFYYKDYDPDLCKQDVCLSELFYPITGSFQGDSFQYSLAVAMILIVISTAYFIVTWPCAHL